ncbi:hypothetical protein AV530_000788 [Patagioenas fasciata monilis]|uniref:Uncharacterized protein n=1 Tax=Patagioenas fasciata monilis TaxID=372326 RepID=A0A1V4KS92_PATFA|nr:hypothetical protein AV530_000788 [Patagioenas fasciata monilis]
MVHHVQVPDQRKRPWAGRQIANRLLGADACDLLRGTIPSRQRSCLAHNPEHSPCCQVKHPTQHWGENAGPCSSVFVFLPAQASTDTTLRGISRSTTLPETQQHNSGRFLKSSAQLDLPRLRSEALQRACWKPVSKRGFALVVCPEDLDGDRVPSTCR